jgi:ATP-dependent RNA helicase MSS116
MIPLFSNTISDRSPGCTDSSCSDHKFVDVPENEFPVHAHVPQYHTILPISSRRFPHLLSLLAHDQLSNPGQNKVLLFLPTTCVTQHFATFTRELSNVILPGAYIDIHSKRAQDSRIAASDAFDAEKSGASIFVSSDDSVRGVDYLGVTRVIQFVGWDEIRMFTETTLIE